MSAVRIVTVSELTKFDLGKRVMVPLGGQNASEGRTGIYMYPSEFGGSQFVGGILDGYGIENPYGHVAPEAKIVINGRGFGCAPTCQVEVFE